MTTVTSSTRINKSSLSWVPGARISLCGPPASSCTLTPHCLPRGSPSSQQTARVLTSRHILAAPASATCPSVALAAATLALSVAKNHLPLLIETRVFKGWAKEKLGCTSECTTDKGSIAADVPCLPRSLARMSEKWGSPPSPLNTHTRYCDPFLNEKKSQIVNAQAHSVRLRNCKWSHTTFVHCFLNIFKSNRRRFLI